MESAPFRPELPRDSSGHPLKDVPLGLSAGAEAFRHAMSLAEMSRTFGPDDMMIGVGLQSVADKLRLAAERTEYTAAGPVYNIGAVSDHGEYESGDSRRSSTSDEAKLPIKATTDPAKTEWWAACLFYSWTLREQDAIPDIDEVDEWVRLLRAPNARWQALWAAYCVAQVRSADEAVVIV